MARETEKKTEIRKNAIKLFQDKGYDNVTVVDIASSAGISKNTFYYYFTSKEDLIMDLFKPADIPEDFFMYLMEIDNPLDRLNAIYEKMIEYYTGLGREIIRKALVLNITNDYAIDEKTQKVNTSRASFLLRVYREAQEEKLVRTDISSEKMMWISLTHLMGCLQIWATRPAEIDLKKMYMSHFEAMIHIREAGNGLA